MPLNDRTQIKTTASGNINESGGPNSITPDEVLGPIVDLADSTEKIRSWTIREFLASGNDSNNDAPALRDVINRASGSNYVVQLEAGRYKLASGFLVPENVTLKFAPGAILSLNAGVTGYIEGKVDAPLSQIFSGAGSVKFGQQNAYYTLSDSTDGISWDRGDGNLQGGTVRHNTPNTLILYSEWWGAKTNIPTIAQGAINIAAIDKLMLAMSDHGCIMPINGVMYTTGALNYPNRLQSSAALAPVPFKIDGGLTTSSAIVCLSGDLAVKMYYSGYAVDNLTTVPRWALHDITVVSQGNGVEVSGAALNLELDHVVVTACKKNFGLRITYSYGWEIKELVCYENNTNGLIINNCAMGNITVHALNNSGVGVIVQDSANINSDMFHFEGNLIYGMSGNNFSESRLNLWQEGNNNRDYSTHRVQSILLNCQRGLIIEGEPQSRFGDQFALDPISYITSRIDSQAQNSPWDHEANTDLKASGLGYRIPLPPLFPDDGTITNVNWQNTTAKTGNLPRSGSFDWFISGNYAPIASGTVLWNGDRVIDIVIPPGAHNHNRVGTSNFLEIYPYIHNTGFFQAASGYYNTYFNTGDYILWKALLSLDSSGAAYWKNRIQNTSPSWTYYFNSAISLSNYDANVSTVISSIRHYYPNKKWIGGVIKITAPSSGIRIGLTIPDSTATLGSGFSTFDPPQGSGYHIYLHEFQLYKIPPVF